MKKSTPVKGKMSMKEYEKSAMDKKMDKKELAQINAKRGGKKK